MSAPVESIANQLAGRAAAENFDIEATQAEEWRQSVGSLQSTLNERLPIIREALSASGAEEIRHVILEYDFHRRGLRLDCVLLGDGVLFIIEFKRSKVQRADRDQVMAYAVNLLEFHRVTREWCEKGGAIVVPIISLTAGRVTDVVEWPGLAGRSWTALANKPMTCDRHSLKDALALGLANRVEKFPVSASDWPASPFSPSSSILDAALDKSYNRQGANAEVWAKTGYRRKDARLVAAAASFKIVKAHNFLGNRGVAHRQEDGRVLVFDEAQRTYVEGHIVLGQALSDHEADLILDVQRKAFPQGGAVVVALVGHNQAINRGERGILAWLEAAENAGWSYSISDETLKLGEFEGREKWAENKNRKALVHGHLQQSMRYYRNDFVEKWVGAVLDGDSEAAQKSMKEMKKNRNAIWITRSLAAARAWAKTQTFGDQRTGLIASGQARRLAAEGLL